MVFLINLGTPLVKANDPLLSFSLLFSLVVTFLCSIVYLGEPAPWSCMTSQVALALGFALCLASLMGTVGFGSTGITRPNRMIDSFVHAKPMCVFL